MSRYHDTIAALATPVGTAALAVLRVTGPDTLRIVTEIAGHAPLPRRATHLDYRDRGGALLDDVVLTFFAGPRSYTAEDAAEISCHGNPFIAQKILEDLFARGCRPAEPGEFTQRAFLNGRLDLSQAEAVMDVIHARSERALAAAQHQLHGALGQRMQDLIDRLLQVLAQIEAYIDFPDEDLPPENRAAAAREIERLRGDTGRLLATSHYGNLLRDGITTVIVGEPNVGKSSLLNRLVGRERALVSPEPGTTRDFIEERVLIGGHCFRLIDTAGLNAAPAPLEKLGMEKTREQMAQADILVVVRDGSQVARGNMAELGGEERRVIYVLNKNDLRNGDGTVAPGNRTVRTSAQTGAGIEDLRSLLATTAASLRPETGEETIAINARHARSLTEAAESLASALAKLTQGEAVELLASDLRSVLASYGEIAGKVDNERMLDALFATFCIGK